MQDHIEGLFNRLPDKNSLKQKSLSRSMVGACRYTSPWVRRVECTIAGGPAPAGCKTRNLGHPYGIRPNSRFYNLCRIVLAAMSAYAPTLRRGVRIDLDTIGPLYHDPGCGCSRQAGLKESNDLDPADPPDTPSQGAVMGPTVTRPPFITAGQPATCFARHQPRAGPPPRNMWGRMSAIGLSPTPLASPSGVAGCRLALRASHCLLTECSVHSVELVALKNLLLGCCRYNLEYCTMASLKQNSDTDDSRSSYGEWGGLASPDVLRRYREPRWYMERGAQTDSDGYAGPYRGLGIPNRPARGQATATVQSIGVHARKTYRPRRCGLCYHERVFDTRTGLNNHTSQQHGYYYSLREDCFLPLGWRDVRSGVPSPAGTEYCGMGVGSDARLRGRARRVPGRTRPSYPRGVPPVRYPRGIDNPLVAPQTTRSGVMTAWLPPQFPVLDVEAEAGLPTTPSPPAVPGPSASPPPGEAILQMALADPVEPGDDLEVFAATPEPPSTPLEATNAAPRAASPRAGPCDCRSPEWGSANVSPSPPVSPVALAGHLHLYVQLRDVDPPEPATPLSSPEEGAGSPTAVSTQGEGPVAGPLIPAWLFEAAPGTRTPDSPTGCPNPVSADAPTNSPPLQDSPRAHSSTGPVLLGRWATIEPIGGIPHCHFADVDGPLDRLVLPPAEQVRERYEQALAFVRQRGGRGAARRLEMPASDRPCTQS